MERKLCTALFCALLALAPAGSLPAGAAQGEAEFDLEAGLGYDSNAFLAPREPYFDPFADAVTVPRKRSGFFLPLDLSGEVRLGGGRPELFVEADAELKYFLDRDLANADTSQLELGGGLELLLRERDGRKDTLRFGPAVRWRSQTYVDRDTGERRVSRDDEDQGEKSDHTRVGWAARLRERTLPLRVELEGEIATYDYVDVPAIDSIDYSLAALDAEFEFDVGPKARVALSGEYSRREYDDRRSRNLRGDLVRGSGRTYVYTGAGVEVSTEVLPAWTASLAYDRLNRADEFVGYHDYARDRVRAGLEYDSGGRLELGVEAAYWRRDYPRAFAFDDPEFARLDYDAWEISLTGDLVLSRRWKVLAEYEYRRQSSSDPRYDYDRHVLVLGLAAEL